MHSQLKSILHLIALLTVVLFSLACTDNSQDEQLATYFSNTNQSNPQTMPVSYSQKHNPSYQRVSILDRGLQKVMYSVEIPSDWNVGQSIYTNPQNGMVQQFQLDYSGPGGEVIRVVKPSTYSPQYGQSMQSVWQQLLGWYTNGVVQGIRLQSIQSSRKLLNSVQGRKTQAQFPGRYSGFEQRFTGTMNGRPIEGVAYLMNMDNNYGSILLATILIAPHGRLPQVDAVHDHMDQSIQSGGDYQRALAAANQRGMIANARAHQTGMNDLHAETQRRYQELSDLQSRDNADFSDRMRSTGLGYNGNTHTANDRFSDYLLDSYTVENPYSGLQERVDHTYERWYVNPLGQKYGTNDPNFDPSTLPGSNWKLAPRVY